MSHGWNEMAMPGAMAWQWRGGGAMTGDQTPAESGPAPDLTVERLNAVNADTLLGLL
jgi:hypothetical protein